jgi:hypothetical protein
MNTPPQGGVFFWATLDLRSHRKIGRLGDATLPIRPIWMSNSVLMTPGDAQRAGRPSLPVSPMRRHADTPIRNGRETPVALMPRNVSGLQR